MTALVAPVLFVGLLLSMFLFAPPEAPSWMRFTLLIAIVLIATLTACTVEISRAIRSTKP